jgi:hypothetical protein
LSDAVQAACAYRDVGRGTIALCSGGLDLMRDLNGVLEAISS